jgi:hypothetical protein
MNLTDTAALAILAEHGMTGDDAATALRAWRSIEPTARTSHPDARRVESVLRARGIA